MMPLLIIVSNLIINLDLFKAKKTIIQVSLLKHQLISDKIKEYKLMFLQF